MNVKDRFNKKIIIDKESGCWIWQAAISPKGYGQFYFKGSMRMAHRCAYEIFKEPVSESLTIDHLCRNRACVNPDHLEAVPHVVNVRRGEPYNKTKCKHGHEYTPENTYFSPKGYRFCKTCRLAKGRAFSNYKGNLLPKQRTHCPRGHKYDEENTRITPRGSRACKACEKVYREKYRKIRRGINKCT